MAKSVSVIIPFLNEEKSLPIIIKKVLRQGGVFEIILVDDGSTDDYAARLKKIRSKKIKLLKHTKNSGKGKAIQTGLKKATGEYTIIQDADLEYSPDDFKLLQKLLKDQRADFVIGIRNYKNSYILAKIANRLITFYISLIYNFKIKDGYCGYTLGKTSVWKKLRLKSEGFEIQAEMVAKLLKSKYKIEQVNISYSPRSYKEGKKIKAKDFFKAIHTLTKYRFSSS